MPLDQHLHKCDQILRQLEIFLRKHFNISSSAENMNRELESTAIIEIKRRIREVEKKKFDDCLTASGWNFIIANIEKFKNRVNGDFHEIRLLIDELEVENENMALQLDVVQKEAYMLVERTSDQETVNLFHDFFKGKNKRAL
jgi:hypothetical protein